MLRPERVGRMGRCAACGEPTDWRVGDLPAHPRCVRRVLGELQSFFGEQLVGSTKASPCQECGRPTEHMFAGGAPTHVSCAWEFLAEMQRAAREPAERSVPAVVGSSAGSGQRRGPAPAGEQPVEPHPATRERPAAPVGQSRAPRPPAPARAVARAQLTPASGGITSPVAIADVGRLYLPGGQSVELDDVRHYGDLAEVARQVGLGYRLARRQEPLRGVVLVTEALALELGIPVQDLPTSMLKRLEAFQGSVDPKKHGEHSVVAGAVADGWEVTRLRSSDGREGLARLQGTTRVWHDNHGARRDFVDITLLPLTSATMLRAAEDLPTLADALSMFANHVGTPWRVTSSTTGEELLEQGLRERAEILRFRPPTEPERVGATESELSWTRRPSEEEARQKFVHVYDRSGSYLTGMNGLEVPVGDPQRLVDAAFDPKLPGYWLVEMPEVGDWRLPHPLFKAQFKAGMSAWVTTPSLKLAVEWGYQPQIFEALVWPKKEKVTNRVFDQWVKHVREARTVFKADDSAAAGVAMDLVKEMYTSFIGMMGSWEYRGKRSHPLYQPAWRHHIIAAARSNFLRRVADIGEKTGQWPVAMRVDSVAYLSDEPDMIAAFPGGVDLLGDGLGKFHPERTGVAEEHLQYLTGRPWTAKTHLVAVDKTGRPLAAELPELDEEDIS